MPTATSTKVHSLGEGQDRRIRLSGRALDAVRAPWGVVGGQCCRPSHCNIVRGRVIQMPLRKLDDERLYPTCRCPSSARFECARPRRVLFRSHRDGISTNDGIPLNRCAPIRIRSPGFRWGAIPIGLRSQADDGRNIGGVNVNARSRQPRESLSKTSKPPASRLPT
jgi:hypothetical protein